MSGRANQSILSETLLDLAREDARVIALVCDSRFSAHLAEFAASLPAQFIEVGIAEQNAVGIAAGLATCGKIPFVFTPACFLSMRSAEQIKVDVAYSQTNVKLVGISGGVSYGALGPTHHSLQDLAITRAIPGLTVVVPSDNRETALLVRELKGHRGPVYIRTGRGPAPDVHETGFVPKLGKGCLLLPGMDLTIIACGEVVRPALDAGLLLRERGISARVIEIHTIKPLDEELLFEAAEETGAILTVEEHSVHGGLGGAVAELLVQHGSIPMRILGIPDEPAVVGSQVEIFRHYGLTTEGIAAEALKLLDVRRRAMGA